MVKRSIGFKVLIMPLSLAVAVIIVIFYIVPTFQDMNKAKSSLAAVQSQIETAANNTVKLNKIKAEWEASATDQALIGQALPEEKDSEKFMAELYSKASQSGVLLSGITIAASAGAGSASFEGCASTVSATGGAQEASIDGQSGLNSGAVSQPVAPGGAALPVSSACPELLSFSLSAKGTWSQLMDFLKYVNEASRVAKVSSVQITGATAATQEGGSSPTDAGTEISDILTAAVSVEAYYKNKSAGGDTMSILGAADSGKNQKAIQRINDSVFRPYQVQSVESGGERNPFK